VISNNRWITSVAGRFGVTNDTWLFYGKAGGGWIGRDNLTITNTVTAASITGSTNNTSRLAGGCGHRMGGCTQLVREDRV
jgi:outer membrane immunogenic protein